MKVKLLTLSVEESRELENRATEDYGVPSFLLMENAGRSLAGQIEKSLELFPRTTLLIFMCGGGMNGGDGLVAARHLYLKHPNIRVYLLSDPNRYKGDTLLNYVMLRKLGVSIQPYAQFPSDKNSLFQNTPLVFVDAMLGTGLSGKAEGAVREAIEDINGLKRYHNAKVKVISADIPSGLSGDDGPTGGAVVQADLTVAFGCLKKGLIHPDARPYVGRVETVDIGFPDPLLRAFVQ